MVAVKTKKRDFRERKNKLAISQYLVAALRLKMNTQLTLERKDNTG